MKQRHIQMAASFLLASGLTACSGAGGSLPAGNQTTIVAPASNGTTLGTTSGTALSATAPSAANRAGTASSVAVRRTADVAGSAAADAAGIAINVGGLATGSWVADTDVTGGFVASTTHSINTNALNSAPQSVYQSNRNGSALTATIPRLTPLGAYTVRLHFAETFWTAAGKRAFNASINGTSVLTKFDIFAAAGGANRAVVKDFKTTADASGTITIVLTVVTNNASISGIEVIAGAATATPTPAPSSSPTPAPVLSPTPQPTPVSTPTPVGSWTNVFPLWNGNHLLPANPTVHPQSQAMMDLLYNNQDGHSLSGPALSDAQSSYYNAKSTDPVHTIHCAYKWGAKPSGNCAMEGQQIHIPAGAVPGANSDQHTSILQPDGCTLDDFWQMQANMSPSSLTASFGAQYNECTQDGFVQGGGAGATAGGGSNRLGRAPLAELQTGVIHHAIEVAITCNPDTYSVTQSTSAGGTNTCVSGDSGPSIPYGATVWSDILPQNLPSSLDKATRMICTALNQYGGVVDDTIGPWNGMSLNTMWNTSGNAAYAAWFSANSSGGSTHPANCFPGGDWSHHIHVLAW